MCSWKGKLKMNICIIGAGYVGITTSVVLAELGHQVTCIDKDKERISQLQNGQSPIYEPGLKELIKKNQKLLKFSWNIEEAVKQNSIIIIAVGTPSSIDGSTNLSAIYSVIELLATTITTYKTIITKSTVPPGTNQLIKKELLNRGISSSLFNIVSNPEFLREGTAIYDALHPNKTVVGIEKDDLKSLKIVKEIYRGIETPYTITSLNGAEMIKYTANVFLATKISFINEIARICDAYEVDVTDVAEAIGLDPRINPYFLQAGLGFGGSCFPKDLHSMIHFAQAENVTPSLLNAVKLVNDTQVNHYITKLKNHFTELKSTKIAILGLAFKPNTDDIRESRAIRFIEQLTKLGCEIHVYDPIAKLPSSLEGKAWQHQSLEKLLSGVDCVVIATEWDEIKSLDWNQVKSLMNGNVVLDGRNCFTKKEVEQYGLHYIGVGRA